MDISQVRASVDRQWQESIIERLTAYVRIPDKSPMFDPDWERHGHIDAAANLIADWCRKQPIADMKVEVRRLAGLTPIVLIDVPGEIPDCVLLYGHLDKQPEFTGWLPGLAPWEPVIRDGKLYGRGGADDGYAAFSSLAAIVALKEQRVALPRCVILIEASEESGSIHLPAHLRALGETLGQPSLVVCLDAEAGNYEQVWCTTSLRGNLVGELRVRMLNEGVHSGMGTGIAATPFRVVQQLLARLESPVNGDILIEDLQVMVPADRRAQIMAAAKVLGDAVARKVPFADGVQPLSNDPVELLINTTWRATLAVTGADGLPPLQNAGNVLLPEVGLKLSLRLPPTVNPGAAAKSVKAVLERDPPYGAQVSYKAGAGSPGWNAPPFAPWLEESISAASRHVFGKEAVSVGSGGTIPFMGMLGEQFPQTQFFITGVLGPQSNAHGPNEFLHIEYAQKLTACVALVLADHAARKRSHS
jgi:acetylornithine deacetylase/succinyl-diaminopimelate desuccinylase-like protein